MRWETEFYQAHSTFQTQIARSTECEIVIGILKWRLGTPLPDGLGKICRRRPYPSGTAYEILSAVAKRQAGGQLPDVFVFRYARSSPPLTVDDPERERIESDWFQLKQFFQEWFVSERGSFKAAFNPYVSEDDFEAQLEKLLRKWLAEKVSAGRAPRWPIEIKGSPFRGLDAFGAKHAPVFFGRAQETARAVDLWREAGARETPFLIVIGASGSGKSSLARAGVIPRLTTPGVIAEVDLWRVAATRPSDSPDGPFASLATALMQGESELSKDEEGRSPALPEIADGDCRSILELAAVLRADVKLAARTIVNALQRIAAAEREREAHGRELRCDLALLIDQLDELFAATVSEAERADFVALIAGLVRTTRVWLIVTLRADLYARLLEQPALKALKERGATFDLRRPTPRGSPRFYALRRRRLKSPTRRTRRVAKRWILAFSGTPTGPICCRWCSSPSSACSKVGFNATARRCSPTTSTAGSAGSRARRDAAKALATLSEAAGAAAKAVAPARGSRRRERRRGRAHHPRLAARGCGA